MYYVVTSKDLRNFLMGLGLTFKILHEALEFYSKFRYNK
jgi:hypothetical protein